MIQYELQKEHAYNSEYGVYETYGVAAYLDDKLIRSVGDISLSREKVERLVRRFNEEQLSPAQLDEVIECFLYDFEV